jgi:hypothetical protein
MVTTLLNPGCDDCYSCDGNCPAWDCPYPLSVEISSFNANPPGLGNAWLWDIDSPASNAEGIYLEGAFSAVHKPYGLDFNGNSSGTAAERCWSYWWQRTTDVISSTRSAGGSYTNIPSGTTGFGVVYEQQFGDPASSTWLATWLDEIRIGLIVAEQADGRFNYRVELLFKLLGLSPDEEVFSYEQVLGLSSSTCPLIAGTTTSVPSLHFTIDVENA